MKKTLVFLKISSLLIALFITIFSYQNCQVKKTFKMKNNSSYDTDLLILANYDNTLITDEKFFSKYVAKNFYWEHLQSQQKGYDNVLLQIALQEKPAATDWITLQKKDLTNEPQKLFENNGKIENFIISNEFNNITASDKVVFRLINDEENPVIIAQSDVMQADYSIPNVEDKSYSLFANESANIVLGSCNEECTYNIFKFTNPSGIYFKNPNEGQNAYESLDNKYQLPCFDDFFEQCGEFSEVELGSFIWYYYVQDKAGNKSYFNISTNQEDVNKLNKLIIDIYGEQLIIGGIVNYSLIANDFTTDTDTQILFPNIDPFSPYMVKNSYNDDQFNIGITGIIELLSN